MYPTDYSTSAVRWITQIKNIYSWKKFQTTKIYDKTLIEIRYEKRNEEKCRYSLDGTDDLPREGKDLMISEYGPRGHVRHTFKWDGMKPVYAKSEVVEDLGDGEHCDEDEE